MSFSRLYWRVLISTHLDAVCILGGGLIFSFNVHPENWEDFHPF